MLTVCSSTWGDTNGLDGSKVKPGQDKQTPLCDYVLWLWDEGWVYQAATKLKKLTFGRDDQDQALSGVWWDGS